MTIADRARSRPLERSRIASRSRGLGRWRIVVELDGKTLCRRDLRRRGDGSRSQEPPAARDLRGLRPASPTARDVVECVVSTSLVAEDPDYDIVRYRYRWIVDGKLVRAVQSAALSDVLRKGLARPGKTRALRRHAERRAALGADGDRDVGLDSNPGFAWSRRGEGPR